MNSTGHSARPILIYPRVLGTSISPTAVPLGLSGADISVGRHQIVRGRLADVPTAEKNGNLTKVEILRGEVVNYSAPGRFGCLSCEVDS